MSVTSPASADALAPEQLSFLRDRVLALRQKALDLERFAEDEIALVHPDRRIAARNLVDYLALRELDIRELQLCLFEYGLSSFGVVQGHVMASINAVIRILDRLCQTDSGVVNTPNYPAINNARRELNVLTDDTLGAPISPGMIRIMVTMPSEAATDARLVESLVEQGMTIMRVNCAHDGPEAWSSMVRNLAAARETTGKACRVAFDLAGPKLRTGAIEPGPEVLRFKPVRDKLGNALVPVTIAFGPTAALEDEDIAVVPIDSLVHELAKTGDEITLRDTRGRERTLAVIDVNARSLLCSTERTTYLATGMRVDLMRRQKLLCSGKLGKLPPSEASIHLAPGDSLIITRDLTPGRAARMDEDQETVLEPARIACTLPEVFDAIAPGHRVLLDDGKFEGVVSEVSPGQFRVDIARAGRGQAELKAEKGINLPDTPLNLPALTAKDLKDLEFVCKHADLVSLSFVRRPEDIEELYDHLRRLKADTLGVILKIENGAAFQRLPELLMTAAKRKRIAVMVARGDLGVEIGFERLAEVQEEMLWLCEAAQTPVIWATQVLESLARNGLPSRGEVTDAAMSIRAECVMLNKGPYIGQAIRFLTDVSRRMTQHSSKTFATHRALKVATSDWLEVHRSGGS